MENDFYLEIEKWMSIISDENILLDDIIAFHFGLFESTNGYVCYCIGSKEYNEEDDDWTINEDFVPHNKYLKIPITLTQNKNWVDILNIICDLFKKYISSIDFEFSFLKNAQVITVGFDDSDLVRLK